MSLVKKYLITEKGLEDWDEKSLKKFAKTIGKKPTEHGFFDACVTRMSKHFSKSDAEGFCAKIKDKAYGSTYWRGKGKSKKEIKKDTKKHKNVED